MSRPEPVFCKTAGIVIAPILFVVALMGILVAVLVAGSDFFGTNSATAKNRAQASAILQYTNAVKVVVDKLVANGCDETQLDFTNDQWKSMNGATFLSANPSALSACKVFVNNGAAEGVIAQIFEGATSDTHTTCPVSCADEGHSAVQIVQVEGVGTTAPDLVLVTHYLTAGVCEEFNRLIQGSATVATLGTYTFNKYAGDFSGSYTTPFSTTGLANKMQVCGKRWGAAPTNQTYTMTVLLAR